MAGCRGAAAGAGIAVVRVAPHHGSTPVDSYPITGLVEVA